MFDDYLKKIGKLSEIAACIDPRVDYQKNGIWYCGKCHTPKQCTYNANGESITRYCLCKCLTEERDAEKEQTEQKIKSIKKDANKRNCFDYPRMKEWNFANAEPSKYIDMMHRFVDNFKEFQKQQKGITLYGGTGTGKSYLAACAANALLEKGYTVRYTSVTKVASLDTKDAGKMIDDLDGYDLLILDDIFAERDTPFAEECLYHIVEMRSANGKPMIVTTNMNKSNMEAYLRGNKNDGISRIMSRLLGSTIFIEVIGNDRRKDDYNRTRKTLSDILKG